MSLLTLIRIISNAKKTIGQKNPSQLFTNGFEYCEGLIQVHIERNPETFNKELQIDQLTREKVRLQSEVEKLNSELARAKHQIEKQENDPRFLKKEYMVNTGTHILNLTKRKDDIRFRAQVISYANDILMAAEKLK
jgi:predicted RNase H-like nuclease (RuvC/YqgF family)